MNAPSLRWWRFCIAAMAVLAVLSLSPLVIAPGAEGPQLLGLPRTLWAGLLIAALMVFVTWVGTRVHPGGDPRDRTGADPLREAPPYRDAEPSGEGAR